MPLSARPLTHELRFTHVASGARIAWARSGRLGAPVLLRAAHWMTHVDYDLRSPLWQPFIERIGRQLEVVRYDERGCGLSTADDVLLSLDTAVEEIEVVAEAHGAERFALLGISGGAAAAVAYAARHSERVSHLILLAGYTHGLLHRNPSAQTLAFHEAQLKLIELGWGRNDPGVQAMFTSRFMPGGNAEQIASFSAIAHHPLVAMIEISQHDAMADWLKKERLLLIAGLMLTLLTAGGTWIVVRSLRARMAARIEIDAVHLRASQRETELTVTLKSLQELIFRTDATTDPGPRSRWPPTSG